MRPAFGDSKLLNAISMPFGSEQIPASHVLLCTYFMCTGVELIRKMLLYCEPNVLEHV